MYKDSPFSKELKQAYLKKHTSMVQQLCIAVFTALFTFSIHFILQTMTRSVLSDALPWLMQKSHFSSLSLYLITIQVFYTLYFIFYYEYLTFAEIRNNKWYVLVKNKVNPSHLIYAKLFVRCLDVSAIYSIGFGLTFFLCMFLKYPLVYNYFLSLYLVGLINLLLLVISSMVCSLFIHKKENARLIILLIAFFTFLFGKLLGYHQVIHNRPLMSKGLIAFNIHNSLFPLISAIVILICVFLIFIETKNMAAYTNFEMYNGDKTYSDHYKIIVSENGDFKNIKDKEKFELKLQKILEGVASTFLVLAIMFSVLLNIIILFVSLASPEREVTLKGYIPYVFHSETMEPSIMYNDLTFFHVVDENFKLEKDKIVLYKNNIDEISVARILNIHKNRYEMDIDNYVIDATKGQLHEYIDESSIYGIYTNRSRWLGVIILFGNSTLGRILMLLIPTVLLFYYKPIINSLKKKELTSLTK